MALRVIIDTDPGVDDMVAILAALHDDEFAVEAITTVGGNEPVQAGLTVRHTAAEVHGDDGLAGCPWPDAGGLAQVVLMGGDTLRAEDGLVASRGNITAEAEFNIYSDVEAARTVFASGAPVTVVPLDVSQRTLVSRERIDLLEPAASSIATATSRAAAGATTPARCTTRTCWPGWPSPTSTTGPAAR